MLFLAFLASAVDSAAQEGSSRRTPVTRDEVGEAIAKAMRPMLQQAPASPLWDFEIPLAVPAASPHRLAVVSLCRSNDPQWVRVHLACDKPGDCLPFLAYVKVGIPVPVRSCGFEETQDRASPRAVRIIHAGDRATAVLATAGFRMSARVLCLDGGAVGETIRVRAREGRIFQARISGPALVEVKGGE